MTSRDADHALGLELQLEELVERQKRAAVQGRTGDAEALSIEIAGLQGELAATAERATAPSHDDDPAVIHAEHPPQRTA